MKVTCPTCAGKRTIETTVPNVKKYGGVEYVSAVQPAKVRVDVCATCVGLGFLRDVSLVDLGNGNVAIIDSEDAGRIAQYSWHLAQQPHRPGLQYVAAWAKPSDKVVKIRMHRLIIDAPDGVLVDHINGNGLDNRKSNIRTCNHSENQRNRGPQRNSVSQYKGVSLCRATGRWRCRIQVDGKDIWIGRFDTESEAAHAYDAAARIHHGAFAYLNFPNAGTVDDADLVTILGRTLAAALADSDRAGSL